MEIKKCTKCGAFIMTSNNICESCSKTIAYENTVLKSYFDETQKTQKTYALVKNIDDFEYIITNSELDAFSLENNLSNSKI